MKIYKNIYFWVYIFTKMGMLYTMITNNWIGLIGFTIATLVSYIEMMKK
jgi:hypothetical protein